MSFWSTITGTTPQSEQEAQLAAKKQQFQNALEERKAAGTISDERAADLQDYVNSVQLEDTDAAARQGFQEGLQEGLGNIGSGLKNALSIVPWQLWVGAGLLAFLYFGGFALVKRALKRR
jgi:hypothetical protein